MSAIVPASTVPLIRGTNEPAPLHMPQLGLGTYKIGAEQVERVVRDALDVGYRHIDTAQMYGNEAGVGAALASSRVPRDHLWVTSKLDNPNHRRDLRLDVLDLFLVHWPMADSPGIDLVDTWRTMIDILESGRVRAIGVSNFQAEHLRTIIKATGVTPAVNQIELHPYFGNREVSEFCRKNGIVVEAWAPLVRGVVTGEPLLAGIAAAHGCTPAQAVLAWHLAKGHVIFPKSASPARIEENLRSTEVHLTIAEVEAIDELDRGEAGRTGYNPDTMKRVGQ